jgi:prepilin-type N-terminal cleavage/methylation domain-containing protein
MSSPRHSGFTLIELLVTVGIITLLVTLLLPVINHVRDSGRRASELSNLRQLAAACITYCQDNDGTFPIGRMSTAPVNSDDYTWINYTNCWKKLTALAPGLNNINSCFSVRDGYPDIDDFGVPEWGNPNDTKVGWIYWGGRDDLFVSGNLQYRSLRRLGQHPTPGSHTLWTCWCWDSAGTGSPSMCPHVGPNCVMYPSGVVLNPPPDGLGVALDDGSASFVHWTDLIIIPQANGYKLYYQP